MRGPAGADAMAATASAPKKGAGKEEEAGSIPRKSHPYDAGAKWMCGAKSGGKERARAKKGANRETHQARSARECK